jgi:hypothetical protein
MLETNYILVDSKPTDTIENTGAHKTNEEVKKE